MSGIRLRGGLVVDGTGAEPYRADVSLRDGVIVAIGEDLALGDAEDLDVTGLVVAPGFVDLHAHSDLSILGHPQGTGKVLQGVTTEVVGNCGLSVAPVASREVVDLLRPLMGYCEDYSVEWDWLGAGEYLARVHAARPYLDIQLLAGHNAVRGSVIGLQNRPASPDELHAMQVLLDEALSEGAVGLSLGLMYPPSSYGDERELIALGEVLARHDALLASHMADYGAGLLDAVAAMLRVAKASGCRLQISHLAVVGRENWGMVSRALEMVDAAVAEGVDVAVDFYPYLAGSTNLSQLVPPWSLEGGLEGLRERLQDGKQREILLEHLNRRSGGWDEILVVFAPASPESQGMSVADAAKQAGVAPADLVIRLLTVGDPTIVAFGRGEEDLLAVAAHPRSMLGSDGVAVDTAGSVGGPVPHPRFFGAYPALFQKLVRERPVLTLQEAVRKCTSAPAERIRLYDRGRLAVGLRADVVVFDATTITDNALYTDSRRVPSGIEHVIARGQRIAHAGRILPRL